MQHDREFDELVTDLQRRHPRFRRATIERLVARVGAQYREAPVQDFVYVLVRRQVSEQLRYAEGSAVPDQPAGEPEALLNA